MDRILSTNNVADGIAVLGRGPYRTYVDLELHSFHGLPVAHDAVEGQ